MIRVVAATLLVAGAVCALLLARDVRATHSALQDGVLTETAALERALGRR